MLKIGCMGEPYATESLECRAIPDHLEISAEGTKVIVRAGASAVIPGSNGYLSIRCSAVNSQTATLEITRADDRKIDPELPIDSWWGFKLGSRQYVFGPSAINYRGSDSLVTVGVWGGAEAEERMVRMLEGWSRADDFTLIFNGHTFRGPHAEDQISRLYQASSDRSIAGLFKAVAEREKAVGTPVMVDDGHHGSRPFRDWAIDQLKNMGWTFEVREPRQVSSATANDLFPIR